jgi:ADP-ribosylglycohydrolase
MDDLFKKTYGALAGGAIGDAMGQVTEMMLYPTIERVHGWIEDLRDTGAAARFSPNVAAGTYTDDTRLKHLFCEAIIRKGGRITADDLAQTWLEQMKGWYYTPVLNAYFKLAVDHVRPRNAGRGNMSSNSTAMAIAPIGMLNACDPRQAAQDAYEVACLVHETYALDAAAAIAAAVAAAFSPDASVDSILEASTAYLDRDSEMRDLIASALDLARRTGDYTRFRAEFYRSMLWQRPQGLGSEQAAPEGYYDIAEPRETIPTVLALVYLAGGRARDAIIYAANFGRDADTIGSMVGGIVGAYQGIDGLPTAWVERVNAVNDVRQDDLARRMLPCITHEIERLEQRLRLLERLRGSASAEALAPVGRSA